MILVESKLQESVQAQGDVQPPAIAQSYPAMASHTQPCPAMASQGQSRNSASQSSPVVANHSASQG